MTTLPLEVRELIAATLDSTDQLEVLLLLLRAPSQLFHVNDIARALDIEPPVAADAARRLLARRLLTTAQGSRTIYQYAPATIGLHAAAEGLAIAWEHSPVAVVKAIRHSAARELRTFADAFRIRRGKS
jgi:DNA-binding MarR family transcriptional regulator